MGHANGGTRQGGVNADRRYNQSRIVVTQPLQQNPRSEVVAAAFSYCHAAVINCVSSGNPTASWRYGPAGKDAR